MRLSGHVANLQGSRSARIAAVDAQGAVTSETQSDRSGQWSLEAPEAPAYLVASLDGGQVAATAIEPEEGASLRFPDLISVTFAASSVPPETTLYLDPVKLEGFPDALLPSLRARPGGVIALHIVEMSLTPEPVQLRLQRGAYRLSGGLISLHPGTEGTGAGLSLSEVVEAETGATHKVHDGDLTLQISSPTSYRLVFARI